VGAVALALLVVLAVLVAAGVTDGLDDRVRELFRPGGHWGDLQMQVDVVVEGLRPPVTVALLGVAGVVAAVVRRSWWPLLSVGATLAVLFVLITALKLTVGRADTHGELGSLGGSFPSGHVATVLVGAGCVALLVRRHPGVLAWLLVALVTGVMAWALLVQTAHWFTDVVGGVLAGLVTLSVAVRLPFTGRDDARPSSEPRG
jgi:membrane-associated phospholipid phosphatase